MANDDEIPNLHRRIAELERELEEWRRFPRVLGDFLRRVGSEGLPVEDARMRLQAAMEGRLTVAPVTDRASDADSDRERNRRIADAHRAIERGDLHGAISIYEELCAQWPDDTRIFLKLGDCYARVGDVANAVTTYLEVARRYEEKDHHLKAVAVYKQILKMGGKRPEDTKLLAQTTEVLRELGALYGRLGILSDAYLSYEEFLRRVEQKPDDRIPAVREAMALLVARGADCATTSAS